MSVDTRELAGMAQDAFEAKDYGKAVITLESLGKERSSDPKVRERERERESHEVYRHPHTLCIYALVRVLLQHVCARMYVYVTLPEFSAASCF